jgi:hypothetical protein
VGRARERRRAVESRVRRRSVALLVG